MNIRELGAAFKAARKATKLSMKEAGNACGRSYQWVDNIESGRREASFEDVTRYAEVVGCRFEMRLVPKDSLPPVYLSENLSSLVPVLAAFSDAPAESIDNLHRILSACQRASPEAVAAAAALLEIAARSNSVAPVVQDTETLPVVRKRA